MLAGVRSPAAGEALLAESSSPAAPAGATLAAEAPAERLTAIQLDITEPAQIAAAAELVAQRTGAAGLDALVNNAGIAVGGPLEILPLEQVRELMEVNFFGQVAVTQALIAGTALRARADRARCPPSAGCVATPYMSPYHASKHAIEALGDALRVELRRSHVQVALVEPGAVATPHLGEGHAAEPTA